MIIKILTTINASDRLFQAQREVSKLGYSAQPYYAIKDDRPQISFNRSMQDIMLNTEGILALFEDDVLIKECGHFDNAISQLPSDWELCYLGANLIAPIFRYSDNLFKIDGAWTTHAVLYNNPKELCKEYTNTEQMFDDWLREKIHPRGKSFIISPMIAWQRPHYSSLWNHIADYTQIFDDSANKLL
jgi:hypothetical protein